MNNFLYGEFESSTSGFGSGAGRRCYERASWGGPGTPWVFPLVLVLGENFGPENFAGPLKKIMIFEKHPGGESGVGPFECRTTLIAKLQQVARRV